MMKNKKHLIVLSVITLLCLCLCLSACGKTNKTAAVKGKTTIRQEHTDDKKKDKKSGKNATKKSGQKQDQPKIVQDKNGSGVETIDTKTEEQEPSGSTQTSSSTPPPQPTENPASGKEMKSVKQLSSKAQEYADYCAMSTDEQYAYYKKFKSADAFMQWYNAAKAAYEKENPATVLEPGAAIDLGGN